MKPATVNLEIYQGDTRNIVLRARRKTGTNPDTFEYMDLTGCTALAQIRPNAGNEVILATFASQILNQSTSRGSFMLTLSAATTAGLTPTTGNTYMWDVQLTFPNTEVKTFARGAVTVVAEVSKP